MRKLHASQVGNSVLCKKKVSDPKNNYRKRKSQASQEGLVTFIIILVILLIFLFITGSKRLETERLEDRLEDLTECEKIANEIYSVFILGDGSESTIYLNKNATVSGSFIIVGGSACNSCCNLTNGSSNSFSISSGQVKIKNQDGNIII